MDFVQGGDFFTLMRKVHPLCCYEKSINTNTIPLFPYSPVPQFKRIPEEWVRMYVMEVIKPTIYVLNPQSLYTNVY
jgi:hypothetical protein